MVLIYHNLPDTVLADPQAIELLTVAHEQLQQRATQIDDEALRDSFLTKVAANRQIILATKELTYATSLATGADEQALVPPDPDGG